MAKAKTTKRSRKAPYLDGMRPPSIKALDDAVELYYETKARRMELLAQEVEQKAEVLRLMKEHGLEKYVDHDYSPELEAVRTSETEENVSVKSAKPARVEVNGDE